MMFPSLQGYGFSVDYWALGVLTYEAFECCTPFGGMRYRVYSTTTDIVYACASTKYSYGGECVPAACRVLSAPINLCSIVTE